jgi:hypothetical protein
MMALMMAKVFRPGRLRLLLRVLVLVAGLLTIRSWQGAFMGKGAKIDGTQSVTASTGINMERKFFFLLYHLGLFPVASDLPPQADTKDEAKRLFTQHPEKLRQDEGSTFRSGDRGRTFLYFVDMWTNPKASAITPSIKPAHHLAFTIALCSLWIAAWAIGWLGRGALLVALIGSNPFQLYTTYGQENVFSWPITTMTVVLAIHLPLLEKRVRDVRWYPWAAAALTGVLVAFVRNFRSEPTVVLFGASLIYLTITWKPWRMRIACIAIMFATLWVGTRVSTGYMERRFFKAQAAVAAVGGSAYTGPREYFHEFWHAVFCGLGDFDTKYGYEWQDLVAYAYAKPRLEKANPGLTLYMNAIQPRSYDAAGIYPIFFSETPGYHDLIRDKVLGDIKKDPKWYAGLLESRVERILETTSRVGFATAQKQYYANGTLVGWACVPLLLLLMLSRRWTELKLLLFSTPLSIAPLCIYSDRGMSYYSCFHVFGAFIILSLAGETMRRSWTTASRRWLAELGGAR